MRGTVFDIRRFSIHDGPGIRTTVFLKGCPIRCLWCQNPEGRDAKPVLWYFPSKCIECGACIAACPTGALSRGRAAGGEGDSTPTSLSEGAPPRTPASAPSGGLRPFVSLDRSLCDSCGVCVEGCPTSALNFLGRDMEVGEVLDEVELDRPFYEESGGGLTLSGGDPLFQPDFSLALLREAKRRGLSTAMESCLVIPTERLFEFVPLVDLFLADMKLFDAELHRKGTGADNAAIKRNLRALAGAGAVMRVRLPLIPGYSATRENIEAVRDFVRSLRSPSAPGGEVPLELLNFNPLARDKYRIAGLDYAFADISRRYSEEEMSVFKAWAGLGGRTT